MQLLSESVQSTEHGHSYVWTDAEMIGRAGQRAHPYDCDRRRLYCKKSHFVNITEIVATMMYDSSVFSSPSNIANTCNLCLCHIYRLIMLQQSGIVTRAGSCDKTRCAQILSDSFASMTIEACQNQPTVSFHYLGGFGMQRPKDIRLS